MTVAPATIMPHAATRPRMTTRAPTVSSFGTCRRAAPSVHSTHRAMSPSGLTAPGSVPPTDQYDDFAARKSTASDQQDQCAFGAQRSITPTPFPRPAIALSSAPTAFTIPHIAAGSPLDRKGNRRAMPCRHLPSYTLLSMAIFRNGLASYGTFGEPE